MDIVMKVVLLIELLGLAAVFGGFFHQLKEKNKNVTNGMFLGSVIQLIAFAIILVYKLTQGASFDVKAIILTLIAVVIAVLGFVFRKKTADNVPVWLALGVLSAVSVAMQVVF